MNMNMKMYRKSIIAGREKAWYSISKNIHIIFISFTEEWIKWFSQSIITGTISTHHPR